MNMVRKMTVCLLLAALLASLFALPAMADITSARNLGDGSVEIQWDNMDDRWIYMVPKMSDDFEADLKTYGAQSGDLDTNKRKAVSYWMAPGQSYWLYTRRTDGTYTQPYAYLASRTQNFDEFRTPPRITDWNLLKKSMEGKTSNINFFPALDMEQDLEYTGYGIRFGYTVNKPSKAYSFLCHIVIVTPDGERIVRDALQQPLPQGGTATTLSNRYLSMENVFSGLLERRGEIPVGTYIFSIYWDGQLVCSTSFYVR